MTSSIFATDQQGQALQIDPREIVKKHLLIVGQTGSGKTTSTLALINQLQQVNYTNIVLDPTGEYRQLPHAVTYGLADNAYLDAGQLSAHQLCQALQFRLTDSLLNHLDSAINALRIQQNLRQNTRPYKKINVAIDHYQRELEQLGDWARSYAPQLLSRQLIEEMIIPRDDDKADYSLLGQQYDRQSINQSWPQLTTIRQHLVSRAFRALFGMTNQRGRSQTELLFALKMFLSQASVHRTLVIDLSALQHYQSSQRVVISLLFHHLLTTQLAVQQPRPVNIVLDEAHRYLPAEAGELADNGIFQVLREGRKANISVTLTTQSPLDLPARLRSQFSNYVLHRLAAPDELKALGELNDVSASSVERLATGEAYLDIDGQSTKVHIIEPSWLNSKQHK